MLNKKRKALTKHAGNGAAPKSKKVQKRDAFASSSARGGARRDKKGASRNKEDNDNGSDNENDPMQENIPSEEEDVEEDEHIAAKQKNRKFAPTGAQDQGDEDEKYASETADQKRLRLARQILQSVGGNKKKKDDFFLQADDEGAPSRKNKAGNDDDDDDGDGDYVAVHRLDQNKESIGKALQEQILNQKQQIYNLHADTIANRFDERGNRPESAVTLKGHTKCITCLQLDPASQHLYSASKDASLIKWDLETQKKTILSYGKDKDRTGHYDEILAMSINYEGRILVTVGKDRLIKLWDVNQEKLIYSLKGHKDTVQAVKFGINSNNFCTAACDRTFKMWDAQQLAFLETFYGHKSWVNGMDAIGTENFITCGFDKQAIVWKTGLQSQLIFQGHDYSIDCVKGVNTDTFLTASQDGSVALWSTKRKKPVYTLPHAHGEGRWITALGNHFNTDLFLSGSYNDTLNAYKLNLEKRSFQKIFSLPHSGIVNDIQVSQNCRIVAFTEGDEHRLGRWITAKAKNRIQLVRL